MNFIETKLKDVFLIEPKVFGDHRGFFLESWSKSAFENQGLFYDFVQDNHSSSTVKGTLRGLHYQKGDTAQAKLVRCTQGAVLDVAVDLRPSSASYLQWVAVELSSENKRQLLIPRGFAHGFLTLTHEVEFLYKADRPYSPQTEGSILWNDPTLAIDWELEKRGISQVILAKKDEEATLLRDSVTDYEGAY